MNPIFTTRGRREVGIHAKRDEIVVRVSESSFLRGDGAARVTNVELFYDLVYVFAVTQLSHVLVQNSSGAGAIEAAVLLAMVWQVWVYTTWAINYLDPGRDSVRVMLLVLMLGSLVLAAELPAAFHDRGWVVAGAYVAMQVGRCLFVIWALRGETLQRAFWRILPWSSATGALVLVGAATHGHVREALWALSVVIDLLAARAGFYVPGMGRSRTEEWTISGSHFAERCQAFVLIALGESIVVTGATASAAGLTSTVVLCLVVAFVETAALWWLYFGAAAEDTRAAMRACQDPGRLARDAYTYLHLPIIAGIIATAVSNDLLIAGPHDAPRGVAQAMILGGPSLYLLGESLFRWRMTGVAKAHRVAVAALILLIPLGGHLETLPLSIVVAALLTVLAVWELWSRDRGRTGHTLEPLRTWSMQEDRL